MSSPFFLHQRHKINQVIAATLVPFRCSLTTFIISLFHAVLTNNETHVYELVKTCLKVIFFAKCKL